MNLPSELLTIILALAVAVRALAEILMRKSNGVTTHICRLSQDEHDALMTIYNRTGCCTENNIALRRLLDRKGVD